MGHVARFTESLPGRPAGRLGSVLCSRPSVRFLKRAGEWKPRETSVTGEGEGRKESQADTMQ